MFFLWVITVLSVTTFEIGPVAAQTSWRTCKAYGDMHLETFDKATFDYQGVCKLKLVDFCGGSSATTLPTFQVYMRGEHRYGSSEVSYAAYVEIVYGGKTVRMARNPTNNTVDVTENGVPVRVPIITSTYTVVTDALYTIYRGPLDLDVRYNGDSTVLVILRNNYVGGDICGVCGNYNLDPADDYVTQTGNDVSADEDAERGKLIGDSWIVASDPEQLEPSKCPASIPSPCVATGDWVARCNGLTDTSSEFARTINCLGLPFMEKLRESCLLDGCYSDGVAVQQSFSYLWDVITIDYPECAGCLTDGTCAIRQKPNSRIIGGTVAGSIPFLCRLEDTTRTGLAAHVCGCSVVSANWVVTAASCMNNMDRSNLLVVAGDQNITASGDYAEQTRHVRRIDIHPDYVVATKDNDIALIELCAALPLGTDIQNITLATSTNDYMFVNNVCFVSGWGSTNSTAPYDTSPVLHAARLILFNQTICKSVRPLMTDNMLCAGGSQFNTSTCVGDSGGPLICWDADHRNVLVGIGSFGRTICGDGLDISVFTRVANYEPWVRNAISAVGAEGSCSCPSPEQEHVVIPNNCTHYCDCYCGFGFATKCPLTPDPNITMCVETSLVPDWRMQECGWV